MVGCVYVRLGAMTVRRRENFQFKNGQQNRGWQSHWQNSLEISFTEGSITEEEFLILYEEYQSEE